MLRRIQIDLREENPESALRLWQELSQVVPDVRLEPALSVRIAEAHAGQGEIGQAAVMLRRALLEAGSHIEVPTALQIARVGRHAEPRVAAAALRLAIARPGLDPDSRIDLQEHLAELESPRPVG
jgi:hypothetical protein